ncbi:MAG: xanthine dehydrogenase family protein molybdopterin-binding subunit [Deltaproteobacteria bacterium]|nr:xanthine dehydrogenase family protein molybdopterin-binding subunit [Deltaproteobacteria bacterium]MDQ3300130.1 xanthine dehydrogenase family protein molybdopterin-binding subunit [Myxococcota bacterium]
MNRRTFLLGTASGALAIGCAFGRTGGRVWRHHQRTGELQPNAWIRILADGRVIFTLDRVEMGQGTMTSHAAMVCEELEVDPTTITILPAEASRAYDNPDRQIRVQITGGSTSTKASWQPLREAGAVAREMLRRAAAETWAVPLGECVAIAGTIQHAKTSRMLRYGELVKAAARQDTPRVRLKDPAQWTLIGKSLGRLDIRPKVDGSGIYGVDVQLPGLLTAVIVRPPVRGGTVAKLDASAARARRGVVDVVQIPEGVAVIAEGYWEARTGAELLQVTWDEGHGGTLDTDALFAAFEKLASARGQRTAHDAGDAYEALGKGTRVEATYRAPYLAHATMEPQNATCWIRRGRCEVWAPTQTPGIARFRVAEAIGFDLDDVAIHTTLIGGGFGRRGLVDYAVEAARLAQRVKRPIKVMWSREDDQEHDWYRPMAVSKFVGSVEFGTGNESRPLQPGPGRITGWLHRLVAQSIVTHEAGDFLGARVPNATPRALRRLVSAGPPRMTARGTLLDPTSIEGAADLPYAIPNLRVEYTPAETGIPVGFWRSVGHSFNAFFTECFFDELAHAAGKDPYELRRELLASHPRHRAVLELAATRAGWDTPLAAGVGRGIAVHASFHSFCAQVAEVSVTGNRVRVHRVVVAIDCGRVVNPGLVAAQVESAVIYGLSAALKQQITHRKGRVQETNFHTYRSLRMHETPVIETHLVTSTEDPTGVGEPGVPPIAPALCNAIFAATGKRIRTLPIEAALASPGAAS